MKNLFLILTLALIGTNSNGQDYDSKRLDDVKGYRLKTNGLEKIIYLNDPITNKPTEQFRRINSRVYFKRIENGLVELINDKKYVQISIPGKSCLRIDENTHMNIENVTDVKFNGKEVSCKDYDVIFWIEEEVLETVNIVYHKYRNDWVFCALTIPFKYRPGIGNKAPSIIDGSFNVGPAIGYKIRLSESRNFYACPVISGGLANFNYNSANNDAIVNSKETQSGTGLQYCGGIVFDFYKVQFGAVLGADHSLGEIGKTFVYNNNLWFGASLSFNFLTNKINVEDKAGNK
jgi:hypothetical protein